jgi:RNA polymerase sigma-70 factor, ECF subfamily
MNAVVPQAMTDLPADLRGLGPAGVSVGEEDLVRAAQRGEIRAFEEIVRLHSRRVYGFLFQMTRHRQDAEDIAQQTFIKAYQNLHRFEPERPFLNWLLTITRRTALNHFRSAKKWEEMPAETASAELSPALSAEARDQAESLWGRARELLSRRDFEIFWLRFGEGLSTRETAQIVGLNQIHVKVLIHRARQELLKGVREK